MRAIFLISFVFVTIATCDSLGGQRGDNDATPPGYSRVNQEVYKTVSTPVRQTGNRNITPPPIPKLSPPTRTVAPTTPTNLKPEEYSKSKTIPLKATYSVPDENSATNAADSDPCSQEYNDPETEPLNYKEKDVPVVQIPSTQPVEYAQQPVVITQQPPLFVRRPAVFAPQPPIVRSYVRAIPRGSRSFVLRRPSYAETPISRSEDFARPIAYVIPVSAGRRVVYSPSPVRYVQRPSVFDTLGGLDYDNAINVDYEEVKK